MHCNWVSLFIYIIVFFSSIHIVIFCYVSEIALKNFKGTSFPSKIFIKIIKVCLEKKIWLWFSDSAGLRPRSIVSTIKIGKSVSILYNSNKFSYFFYIELNLFFFKNRFVYFFTRENRFAYFLLVKKKNN